MSSNQTIANDDTARRKRTGRKYTSRACEECRRRRAKCDGTRPSCSRCLDRGVRCQYSTAEDGRQPAPKSYVVMLRNRIDLLEQVLKNHGIDVEASIAQIVAENDDQHQAQESNLGDVEGDLCVTFEGALTLDESLNFDQDGEVRYFGPTSGRLIFQSSTNHSPENYHDQANACGPSCSTSTGGTPILVSPHCVNQLCDDQIAPVAPLISAELQAHLIDLYFDWEQPWSQVVNETLFRESLACGGRYCSNLLLNCILAVGSRYCDRIEVRSDPNDSNTAGKMFIRTAEKLIQNDLRWPKITTIQSLAIMGIFYIAMGADAAGWLHQGMANRLAIDMGLNMDPAVLTGTVSLPKIEIELRRQIYWALYCHDKLSASYTGRVCTLLDSQGAVNKPSLQCTSDLPSPSANGNPRAASQKDTVQLHRSMIDLCRIIEKVLQSLWSPKPLIQCGQRSAFFDSCILELKTWYYDLPSELKVDRPSGLSQFPHAYTLSMVYHQTVSLLCCPFISHYDQFKEKEFDATRRLAEMDKCSPKYIRLQKALSTSSSSVRSFCMIAQKYRQTFGSFQLSPITATHCTLSIALIIIELCCPGQPTTKHHTPEEGSYSLSPHAAVALCFQVLRELSTSWNIAKRIGKNLEKLYFDRYGNEHLPCLPRDGEGKSISDTGCQLLDSTASWESTVPNLEILDDILNAKSLLSENPLAFYLNQNPTLNRPNLPGFTTDSHVDTQEVPDSNELFANNLGFAFSSDSLPSDYNMFDTLNQMYLEERWY
ncbi:hypothetical protein N7493_003839 [Penicillium malachiteum]|uniref:Zn(2)-C6 fungal-type domain-containing protein n=1 Tax=Penicillium malachiteum TaxID=1324776 RepID=A0AAD6HQG0_9EURO|nr:hypothetical protein N7493_003839 [Penicillium malachiteum]